MPHLADPASAGSLGTGGILLAAGASTRMGGENKLLLELDGVPLVRRAAERALEAGLSPLAVVVGRDADRARAALEGLACDILPNPDFAGATSGSLHLGVRHLSTTCEAAVVILADMVRVTAPMLAALVAATADGAPVAASRYDGIVAPPLLFRRSLFDELLACEGDGCGKAIVRRHESVAAFVDWPRRSITDVDTPEDWARLSTSDPT